ncbi:MAG: 3-dehydroquinate dehydratase [Thermoleophilaceae bacterium]|nr:3-dehydroquinate dehydratase [Thermoleophilaceae bacterium]
MSNRVEIMHGVNLNTLGSRPVEIYGSFTLAELESEISGFARELGLEVSFMQTNHEGAFCERLQRAPEMADALIVNAGAWTHYSYAIRDALEVAGLPTVEVHISDIENREPWRRESVIRDLCFATIAGKGIDGYREALQLLKAKLDEARE